MLALGSRERSTCPSSLPSWLPSGQQPSAHARLSDNRYGQQQLTGEPRSKIVIDPYDLRIVDAYNLRKMRSTIGSDAR